MVKVNTVLKEQKKLLIEPDIVEQLNLALQDDECSLQQFIDKNSTTTQLHLTHNRFDLAFKLLFLKAYHKKQFCEYHRDCYKQHIKAFSDGTFSEPNNPDKNSYQSFETTLINLLEDIDKHGFSHQKSLIPLACDGSILNGAHRTAVTLLLNKNAAVLPTSLPPRDFGYQYFKARGVPVDMLDSAAQTFIEYDEHCFLAAIWPAAQGEEQAIEDILGKVVYQKNICLNYNGAHNFLAQAYQQEPWLGAREKNYPGIKNKLVECFPNFDAVRVYLFKADSLDDVLELKEQIRTLFGLGKHAIHITDSHEETLRLGRLAFNDHAVHFLNHGKPRAFNELLPVSLSGARQHIVYGEQGTLHLYGIRDANTTTNPELTMSDQFALDCQLTTKQLVAHPLLLFWYQQQQFVSLSLVKQAKQKRLTDEDLQDLRIIKPMFNGQRFNKKMDELRCSLHFIKIKWLAKIRVTISRLLFLLGVRERLRKLLKKT